MQNNIVRRGRPRKIKTHEGIDMKLITQETNLCDRCGFSFLNQGECILCNYIKKKRDGIKCRLCPQSKCDVFCDMCMGGYHLSCYRRSGYTLHDKDVDAFTCVTCDASTSEAEELCGKCGKIFESSETYFIGQEVLAEVNGKLYNAKISAEIDEANCFIVHFPGWSKRWDEQIDIEDDRLHGSLACDCCNLWFHISCIPSFGHKGRSKNALYVCTACRVLAEKEFEENKKKIKCLLPVKEEVNKETEKDIEKEKIKDNAKILYIETREEQDKESEMKMEMEIKKEAKNHLTKWTKPWKQTTSDLMKKLSFEIQSQVNAIKKRKRVTPRKVDLMNMKFKGSSPSLSSQQVNLSVHSLSYLLNSPKPEYTNSEEDNLCCSLDPCSCYDIDINTVVRNNQEPTYRSKTDRRTERTLTKSDRIMRAEIYNSICELEQKGFLLTSTAKALRMLTRPTSDMFEDLRFVYEVNKQQSPIQLSLRLTELAATRC